MVVVSCRSKTDPNKTTFLALREERGYLIITLLGGCLLFIFPFNFVLK